MKIRHLQKSTLVRASPEELFAFHANPHNLPLVSPPTTRVRSIDAEPVARVGDTFELRLAEFGIVPLRWTGRWCRVDPPGCLVDELVAGPFVHFRHTHRFQAEGPTLTRLVDEVDYRWRRGAWASWVERLLIAPALALFFRIRHVRTRRHFSSLRRRDPQRDASPTG